MANPSSAYLSIRWQTLPLFFALIDDSVSQNQKVITVLVPDKSKITPECSTVYIVLLWLSLLIQFWIALMSGAQAHELREPIGQVVPHRRKYRQGYRHPHRNLPRCLVQK